MEIIGRKHEQELLHNCQTSGKPEFVAVYGRRRVGKTYLVKQFFADQFDFYTTGIYEGTREEQLTFFCKQLTLYSHTTYPVVDNWFDAFDLLKSHLMQLKKKKRITVFIDEMPWLDTPKSRFIKAFELFWNSWGAQQANLMLIVCGSATTWMTHKLIGSKGGLHNRITQQIHLAPFNLRETEEFLTAKGIRYNRYQIVENYMVMGGTPYYLDLLRPQYSMSQNIDQLFFAPNAPLREEYNLLFRSLFNDAEIYKKIVEAIGKKAKGMTLAEIKKTLRLGDSGRLSEVIDNLCNCDIIQKYYAFGKKQKDAIYQLTDQYTLFYLHFIKGQNSRDEHQWSNMLDSPQRTAWSGYAFEQVCMHHIPQIKRQLGIAGVLTNVCSWNVSDGSSHEQIDLVIDRRDGVVNLCEIKYARAPYTLSAQYINHMNERMETFREKTKTRKALHLTMITTYGLKPNQYSGMVQSEVIMDHLFT